MVKKIWCVVLPSNAAIEQRKVFVYSDCQQISKDNPHGFIICEEGIGDQMALLLIYVK